MIKISALDQCCGCTACASICTHEAIQMKPDEQGFLYPEVDILKCVDCGLCDKVCGFNTGYSKSVDFEDSLAYASRHKNLAELETSRSGATFVALSDYILENGGIVYGAGFTEHFRVIHKRITDKETCKELKGSKYVQSDLQGIFLQVRNDLREGKTVLFTGTPCQVNGLKSFIGNSLASNLYLMDIVCQGVPGPKVWDEYLTQLEKTIGKKIEYVNFRDKHLFPWNYHRESYKFEGETKKRTFPYGFYNKLMFRPSCCSCPFSNTQRPSDITIADFWGWEKVDATFNEDGRGINLVLVNTNKGMDLLKAVESNLDLTSVPLAECLQPSLIAPIGRMPLTDKFNKEYKNKGIAFVMKKYMAITHPSFARRILIKIKRLLCI